MHSAKAQVRQMLGWGWGGAFCQSSGKTDVGMGGWGWVHSAKAQVR